MDWRSAHSSGTPSGGDCGIFLLSHSKIDFPLRKSERLFAKSNVSSDSDVGMRSRCGLVRGWPVLSSHFSPGAAPHVGHRLASIFFGLEFFFGTSGHFAQFLEKLIKAIVSMSIVFYLFCTHGAESTEAI